MKSTAVILTFALLSGCAAKLSFIDRSNGIIHLGITGGTSGSSGESQASIDGVNYSGPWTYSGAGGTYSLANFNASSSVTGTAMSGRSTATVQGIGTAIGTASTFTVAANGNGLINLRGENGMFIRCVYNFNTLSNAGIGQCLRNDGREYDLIIRR